MVCEVVAPTSRHRFAKHVVLVALLLGIGYGVPFWARLSARATDYEYRALVQATKHAVAAYKRWSAAHPGGACPSVSELRKYASDRSRIDPWGGEFETICEPTLLRVHSPGPDGVFGTADDVERTAPR